MLYIILCLLPTIYYNVYSKYDFYFIIHCVVYILSLFLYFMSYYYGMVRYDIKVIKFGQNLYFTVIYKSSIIFYRTYFKFKIITKYEKVSI